MSTPGSVKETVAIMSSFVIIVSLIIAGIIIASSPDATKLVPDIPEYIGTPATPVAPDPSGTFTLQNLSGRVLLFECSNCIADDKIVCRNER